MHHLPHGTKDAGVGAIRSTLQIAEPAVIAERTGITTVANSALAIWPPEDKVRRSRPVSTPSFSAIPGLDFILVPSSMAALSGRVFDGLGVGVPNAYFSLIPTSGGSGAQSVTDSAGHYSLLVAPGDYRLVLNAWPNDPTAAPHLSVGTNSFSLTQNMVMDISLPVERVSLHVQDLRGILYQA